MRIETAQYSFLRACTGDAHAMAILHMLRQRNANIPPRNIQISSQFFGCNIKPMDIIINKVKQSRTSS